MRVIKKWSVLVVLMLLTGCTSSNTDKNTTENPVSSEADEAGSNASADQKIQTNLDQIDMKAWNYNAESDVYWQVGISYCENPADQDYETLGLFIPGDFFNAVENGDGTYSCEINENAAVGEYTAKTAPIVFPVNTPGYSAMSAPTDYTDVSAYTDAGFVYMYAGCRGRDVGAPAGVTDLKAAVRYIRYNEGVIPGSMDRLFSFGMSGGGAQSALVGTSGDSELYTPYLEKIGAVSGVSDAVTGSMCWCPVTNLDVADAAYEWNLSSSRSELSEDMEKLSNGLAKAYAEYLNELKLKDEDGNVLSLEKSETGIYQKGSYYDYIKAVIENSLGNFLKDTGFPYDADSKEDTNGMGNRGMGQRGRPDGNMKERDFDKEKKDFDGKADPGDRQFKPGTEGKGDYSQMDDINRNDTTSGLTLSGTYETPQDYIDALNADGEWVAYDASSGTVSVTSVSDFVNALKGASKDVGAFDALDRSQGENELFGYGDGGAHFDQIEAELLSGTEYEDDFTSDLKKTDDLKSSVNDRVNMYNPMYYLCDYYDGAGTSSVAKYFRIRTGIEQGDTALCTEVNLTLALKAYGSDVDFETVWGKGHVEAERTGDSTSNFIDWVNQCLQ